MTHEAARDYFATLAADGGRHAYYYATLVADIDAARDARERDERDDVLDPDRLREDRDERRRLEKEDASRALVEIRGKRLTYRRINEARYA